MRSLIPWLLYLGLTVYVIADIAQHPDSEPNRLPKGLWILLVILAPYVGALAWLAVRFGWFSGGSTQRPPAPQGPDDDPAFKVWLNEQERRKRQEGKG